MADCATNTEYVVCNMRTLFFLCSSTMLELTEVVYNVSKAL